MCLFAKHKELDRYDKIRYNTAIALENWQKMMNETEKKTVRMSPIYQETIG